MSVVSRLGLAGGVIGCTLSPFILIRLTLPVDAYCILGYNIKGGGDDT